MQTSGPTKMAPWLRIVFICKWNKRRSRPLTRLKFAELPFLQAFLGLTLNWGVLFGYAAVRGHCDWLVMLPLYIARILWPPVHHTIYAHRVWATPFRCAVTDSRWGLPCSKVGAA